MKKLILMIIVFTLVPAVVFGAIVEPISVFNTPKPGLALPAPYANMYITVQDEVAHVYIEGIDDYNMSQFIGMNVTQNALASNFSFWPPFGNDVTPEFDNQSAITPPQISGDFGNFNVNLNFKDTGYNGSFHGIEFDLTAPAAWGSANAVLLVNAKGFDAYTHIFSGVFDNSGSRITGFVAEAPIPGSLLLLGSGILGLIGWRRLS